MQTIGSGQKPSFWAASQLDPLPGLFSTSGGTTSLKKTVLLVDDNPVQLSVRQTVLRQAGLQVQVATSADSALALLRTLSHAAEIGVIVTDHIMPEATGSEFVGMLREINPTVPVIVISGMPEAEQEYEGLKVIFRQKPCPPPELIKLVESAVNAR
jgi:CheY-like chemotaxis protein